MEKALIIQNEVQRILQNDEVFLVGGSVRDIVIGKEPKDYDFTTSLTPDEMKPLIVAAGRRVYNIGRGEKHGTVTFKVEWSPRQFEFVEVTTHRTDVYDGKSRQPITTFGVSLDEDLARRDFTMNAMVLKNDGTIYDPYSGQLDILARLIKTVGVPKDRITEDPLRMLRAVRFASQLDFSIDPNMIGKMKQLGYKITNVSKERWVLELDKMLVGKNVMRGMKALMQSDLMKYVLPEVYLAMQDEEAYQATAVAFDSNEVADVDSAWAMIFNFIGYPFTYELDKRGEPKFTNHEFVRTELLQGISARLKFSNDRRDNLLKNKILFKSIDL